MKSISSVILKSKLDAGERPHLLDVREVWEYDLCNIKESINISMSNVEKIQNEFDLDDEIIVICHHGMRSLQVASYLVSKNYSNVTNLEGGVDAWAKFIDSTMAQY